MFANGKQIIDYIDHLAPHYLAENWDMIGLQIGTLNKEVRKVMLTLDVTPEVVDEAIREKIELIIAHHPIIFHPLKHIRTDILPGSMYEKMLKHDIAFYAAHTNLDAADGGVSDILASLLKLQNMTHLVPTHSHKLKKLVVFVPEGHQDRVRQAVCEAGAGWIGNYSHCTFNTKGYGTFMPLTGTSPYIGMEGKLEQVDELRLETIVSEDIQENVIRAMLTAHPYEEVAYDLYPLEIMGKEYGYGKVGMLEEEMSFSSFIQYVKDTFGLDTIRYAGDLSKTIKKIAISGGEGNDFIVNALQKGVDVFITGDLKYHKTQEAWLQGLNLIDVGHYIERHMMISLTETLGNHLREIKVDTEVYLSTVDTNPFRFA